MKEQRETGSLSLLRDRLCQVHSGAWGQGLEGFKISVPGNLHFTHKQSRTICPRSAVYSMRDTLEISCDFFVKHGLIGSLVNSSII